MSAQEPSPCPPNSPSSSFMPEEFPHITEDGYDDAAAQVGGPSEELPPASEEVDPSHQKKLGSTTPFDLFKQSFDAQADPEVRLQLAINFMEAALSQGGAPHFRHFWEARRLCLPLFRENISPTARSLLWEKYSELSKEARRLKEILDEQSAFAVEQIEMAIQGLEEQIAHFDAQVDDPSNQPEFRDFPPSLNAHYEDYRRLQKQLNILNAEATRINALRKELLKTEMRVGRKNKIFQRLSLAGDQVFPKRKELIKQISEQFISDVELFMANTRGNGKKSHESFYILREEIKALQNLAKILTLNTHAFTQTRTRLSECWDQIKLEEKERKKERAQQRLLFKQNQSDLEEKISALKTSLENHELSPAEALKIMDSITTTMRHIELGRDEVRQLRDRLGELRALIQDKLKLEEEARHRQELERDQQKKEKYRVLKEEVEALVRQQQNLEAEQLAANRDLLLEHIHHSALSKIEKQELERLLKPLRDVITEKREKALLALSDDDRHNLQQLQRVRQQRQERRREIKEQLEALRQGAGSSSLDFEKAMTYTVQINEEKGRLEKANQAIEEIEQKIIELQMKMRT